MHFLGLFSHGHQKAFSVTVNYDYDSADDTSGPLPCRLMMRVMEGGVKVEDTCEIACVHVVFLCWCVSACVCLSLGGRA